MPDSKDRGVGSAHLTPIGTRKIAIAAARIAAGKQDHLYMGNLDAVRDWATRFDERYLRPTEVDQLLGDASRCEQKLGWTPKVLSPSSPGVMVDAELRQYA